MSINVLITGASGFVGKHLINHLLLGDYQIAAGVFGGELDITHERLRAVRLDLTDDQATNGVIQDIKPDWVFHLAALSSPAASFSDNNKTLINNISAQANLLNALLTHSPQARTLVVGSAEEYGKVGENDLPITENCPFRPMSPYATSKITQDFMGLQYFLSHKLPVIRVRPFNHTGAGQAPLFVLPAFAQQVAKIEAGLQPPTMTVGNLSATRDFTDVADMVSAYELAMQKGIPGDVYNLGSGNETSIQSVLDMLLALSQVPIEVVQDPARMQQSDVPRLRADSGKFQSLTGWKPKIPLQETISRVLDYWRQKVKSDKIQETSLR